MTGGEGNKTGSSARMLGGGTARIELADDDGTRVVSVVDFEAEASIKELTTMLRSMVVVPFPFLSSRLSIGKDVDETRQYRATMMAKKNLMINVG